MSQMVTVNLSSELYGRIKQRADEAHRSVAEEAAELLAATVPAVESYQADLQQAIASLELLDQATVERAARGKLADELAVELESLHFKQQREGLTAAESARCADLVRANERSMLIRAHAAAVLKRRGVDLSHVVALPWAKPTSP